MTRNRSALHVCRWHARRRLAMVGVAFLTLVTFLIAAGVTDGVPIALAQSPYPIWLRQFGTDTMDIAVGAAVHRGSVFVAGRTYGAFAGQSASGTQDVFVARFDDTASDRLHLPWVSVR